MFCPSTKVVKSESNRFSSYVSRVTVHEDNLSYTLQGMAVTADDPDKRFRRSFPGRNECVQKFTH